MRTSNATLVAMCIAAFAGQGWSGERGTAEAPAAAGARIETWRIADPHGTGKRSTSTMIVVRDEDTVEARVPGRPVRVWRRLDDGVELREIDIARGTMVVHAPGDLRAEQHAPVWSRVLAMPAATDPSAKRISTRTAPAAQAFTDTTALREVDGIDDGD